MAAEAETVLLTGGTGLVGEMLARGFAGAGYRLVVTSRSAERLAGAPGEGIVVDLEAPGAPAALVEELRRRDLLPHVLVNAARNVELLGFGRDEPAREDWVGTFALDVAVPHELATTLARLPGSPLRAVINIGSIYGVVVPTPALYNDFERESVAQYGVAKAALVHLTKELAVRLGPRVRANAISYGGIRGRAAAVLEARYAERCVQGRMLEEADVVGPALFLASEASSGVTGHNLVVDGGWTLS